MKLDADCGGVYTRSWSRSWILGYNRVFLKSLCTSVNEQVVHGIPFLEYRLMNGGRYLYPSIAECDS
jgi:hypothetical protein